MQTPYNQQQTAAKQYISNLVLPQGDLAAFVFHLAKRVFALPLTRVRELVSRLCSHAARMFLQPAMNDKAMYSDQQDQPRDHYEIASILQLVTTISAPASRKTFRSSSKLGASMGGRRCGIKLARLCHAEKLEMLLDLVVV
jgi:hypothetical protein